MNKFKPFPKMARLRRDCLITEKIDGTNASIFIVENNGSIPMDPAACFRINNLTVYAGSRTRWITPQDDNFGFAKWVCENDEELIKLGLGHHFGEWWGSGIQRNYGFKNGERFFSLFNAGRWVEHDKPTYAIENSNPTAPPKFTEHAPACCKVVPILYEGIFDTAFVNSTLTVLGSSGSKAAVGFMNPEGIIVYHKAAGVGFKMTLDNDDQPKGKLATTN
jgi:hypothetical protein